MTTSTQYEPATQTLELPDGRTVTWTESGSATGRPLIWFHGAPGSRLDAAPGGFSDAPLTAAGIRLIAADRAGYGGSSRHEGRTVTDVARDTAALADALALDSFAVVGWSAGASMALATAALVGPRVTSVGVLAGVAPPSITALSDLAEAELLTLGVHDPATLVGMVAALAVQMRQDAMAAAGQLLGPHLSGPDLQLLADPAFATSMGASLTEAARGDLTGYADDLICLGSEWSFPLGAVTQPVVVVHGTDDRIVPIAHGRALAAACPDGSLRETPDGHLSIVAHVADLAAALVGRS